MNNKNNKNNKKKIMSLLLAMSMVSSPFLSVFSSAEGVYPYTVPEKYRHKTPAQINNDWHPLVEAKNRDGKMYIPSYTNQYIQFKNVNGNKTYTINKNDRFQYQYFEPTYIPKGVPTPSEVVYTALNAFFTKMGQTLSEETYKYALDTMEFRSFGIIGNENQVEAELWGAMAKAHDLSDVRTEYQARADFSSSHPSDVYGDLLLDNETNKTSEIASSELADKKIVSENSIDSVVEFNKTKANHGAASDSPIVSVTSAFFVFDIPKAISLPSGNLTDKVTVKGNEYKIKSVTSDGNKLKVNVEFKKQFNDSKNYIDYKGDIKNINISFDGLTFNENARLGEIYSIKETVGGYDMPNYPGLLFNSFAVRQKETGKDVASSSNNAISLSLKIKSNNVTFKDGTSDYARVLVETGKSINNDIDKTQSMPANPSKSGYTFVGWSTDKNASKPNFTGDDTVNGDTTVYAIWKKLTSKPNNPHKPYVPPVDPDRINGKDRIETAVKVSQKSYPNGTKAVILANKNKFADVLTAVPFSVQIGAPILFTDTNTLPADTKAEIARLGATTVYINGGENSVAKSIAEALKKEGKSVHRFNGADRYETARLIGEKIRERGNKNVVEIASGETFPDALSLSSLAVKENAPILLSKKNELTIPTKLALSTWKVNKATIAGQKETISNDVEKMVKDGFLLTYNSINNKYSGAKDLRRIGGTDRYETSALIAKYAVPEASLGVYTSGQIFADALVAGPYAGINKAPVLLVKRDSLPLSIANYTKSSKIERAVVIGGTSTVYDSTFNMIKDLLKNK